MVVKNRGAKETLKNSDSNNDQNRDIFLFSGVYSDLSCDVFKKQRHIWRHDTLKSQFSSDILREVVILVAMYSDMFSQVAKICDSFTATD